jgi:hypothetical protein
LEVKSVKTVAQVEKVPVAVVEAPEIRWNPVRAAVAGPAVLVEAVEAAEGLLAVPAVEQVDLAVGAGAVPAATKVP